MIFFFQLLMIPAVLIALLLLFIDINTSIIVYLSSCIYPELFFLYFQLPTSQKKDVLKRWKLIGNLTSNEMALVNKYFAFFHAPTTSIIMQSKFSIVLVLSFIYGGLLYSRGYSMLAILVSFNIFILITLVSCLNPLHLKKSVRFESLADYDKILVIAQKLKMRF